MRTRVGIFAVLIFFGAAPVQAQVGLTPSNPLPATPPTLTAANGDKVIADPAKLVGSSTWNSVLSQVLDKQGAGTYLHFTTIPAWEISNGGTVDWLVVANTGLSWGFAIVPEPSSIVLFAQTLLAAAVAETSRRRRRAAARRPTNSNSPEPTS